MIPAAGILFLAPGNKALFLKRSSKGDHIHEWCFPGGKIEKDELPEDAAEREATEELGFLLEGLRIEHTRQINDEVDFTTFLQRVSSEFKPTIDKEHVGFAWAPIDQPPEPLHPGCSIALRRIGMNETEVAKAIAAGELVSPQRFGDMSLYAMRVSGTGVSFRKSIEEWVWRDPGIYLSQDMIDRCPGLPVIWEHPPKSMLTSDEFAKRIIGTVMFAYPKGDELWSIARIYDQEAIDMMDTDQLSTSPAVVFKDPSVNKKLKWEDGRDMLIEGDPTLLDHLAVCAKGVWDKGGEPTGIENVEVKADSDIDFPPNSAPQELAQEGANKCGQLRMDSNMAEEEKKEEEKKDAAKVDAAKADAAKADAAARADAEAGQKLDKILECLDSLGKRMDAYDAKHDAEEKKPTEEKGEAEKIPFTKDSKKKDGEDEKEIKEKGEPKELMADKKKDGAEAAMMSDKKKDGEDEKEEKKEEEKKDAARMDSDVKYDELKRQFDALQANMPRNVSDEDRDMISEAQARAEQVFSAFGDSAPRPMQNELPIEYRRRLVSKLKSHSPQFKDSDIKVLAMAPEVFKIAEDQIYKDAWTAATTPDEIDGIGGLREVRRRADSGHMIKEYYGQPMAWMSQFTGGRRLAKFNLGNKG